MTIVRRFVLAASSLIVALGTSLGADVTAIRFGQLVNTNPTGRWAG